MGNASCIPNSYRKFLPTCRPYPFIPFPTAPPFLQLLHPFYPIFCLSITLCNYLEVETKCTSPPCHSSLPPTALFNCLNLTTKQHVGGTSTHTHTHWLGFAPFPAHVDTPSPWLVWHSDCIASRVCFECPGDEWRYELFKKSSRRKKNCRKG